MSMTVGAKTKGWIKNNVTGATKNFQFNPTTLSYSRGSTYSEIIAPGQQYPITQWVAGKIRVFPVTLYLYDRPRSTGIIPDFITFIGAFLPPESNTDKYKKPPDMMFAYGFFIRKCVLDDLNVTLLDMDGDGKPIEVELTLTLRQVSP